MDLKIKSFIVFVSLCATAGFAQDPVKAPQTISKVIAPASKSQSTSTEHKAKVMEVRSIHSCEIKKKEAVITTKNADGTLTSEKLILTEK